jgi:hypothetical protein
VHLDAIWRRDDTNPATAAFVRVLREALARG